MSRDTRHITAWILLAALAATAAGCVGQTAAQVEKPRTFKVKMHPHIRYYSGKGAVFHMHRLDVYQPKGIKDAPVILFVHGGGWNTGDKMLDFKLGHSLARYGFVTVVINYRLSPWFRHPAHVRDVARAFDWVKKNIESYGGNPKDVFLCGHSAGGHLISLLALNPKYLDEVGRSNNEIRGVIPVSGVYRVVEIGHLFPQVFDQDQRTLRDASPELHVGESQPSFLIIYADNDLPWLGQQAEALAGKLREKGTPVRVLKVGFRMHHLIAWKIGDWDDPATRAILDFIHTYSASAKGLPEQHWENLDTVIFP